MERSPVNPDSLFRGCLLGGALGDALGAPVEFLSLRHIRDQFGPQGITDFAPAFGKCGAITDDTQMTLFTAEGLLRAEVQRKRGGPTDYISPVHQAYLRWLLTQQDASPHKLFPQATRREVLGWLYRLPSIRSRRAPGTTCILGLRSEVMGTRERPINNSKGCGGLMRVAPVGLFFEDPETAFEMAARIAAITHGHPSGYLAAGAFAAMIRLLLSGRSLESSFDDATTILRKNRMHEECLGALEKARVAAEGLEPSPESVERLGAGWVAEEALAIAVYSAFASKGDFTRGVLLAVNHSGDSDSTGSIVGSLLGSAVGAEGLPAQWVERLELREAIDQMAKDLGVRYRESPEWLSKYPL